MNTLSQHLHAAIYLPPDFIFYTGSRAERLYLLTSGEIELVDESTGERYALMAHRPSSGPSVGGAAANTLGEAEFFQRSTYACGARVLQDMHCFELKFDALWALVLQYRLEGAYKAQMTIHEASLHRSSTHFIVNALRLNLKNAKMAKIMRATETVAEMSNFYLLPNSPFCQVWTLLSASVVIYWALSVPYRIAFETVGPSTVFADVFSCLFLCLDVYFKMSYFAVEVNGDLISTSAEFRRVYMENDLAFDIIACLPVPLMVLGLTQSGVVYCILRCVHMLKLRQLSTLLQRLITFLEPLFNIRFPENVSRILTTVATVWYFGHVICCLLCLIGIHEADASSWLVANNVADRDELSRYLLAYLWSMYTVVTVGYGSVSIVSSEERVLAIVAMISGAILCDAGVAAVLSSMIDAQDRQGGIVKRQFDATAAFCKNHCTFISSDVSKLVLSYFTHLSHSLGGHEEMSDVAALPPVIWLDLVRMASLRSLCAIDFIDSTVKDLKLGFVNSLVLCAEPYIAYPGQILGGPLSDDLFILRRGKVYSMGSSAVVMLNGRCPAHSLASVASDDPDDDVAGSKYSSSHKEYLHKGSVIYKASEVRRDMSKNQADDIAGAVPLAKSVFVTIVSISDFQDRACYMGKNGTTDMPEGPGNAGLSTGGGYGEEYRSNLKPRAAVESILSAVNSVMSRGVSSYVRITCGAQKARTTTEVRRGTNRWKPALLPSTGLL